MIWKIMWESAAEKMRANTWCFEFFMGDAEIWKYIPHNTCDMFLCSK